MAGAKKVLQRLMSLTVLVLLLATVVAGTSENINAQLLKLGLYLWDDYFILRNDQSPPACDPIQDIEQRLATIEHEQRHDNANYALFEEAFDPETTRQSLQGQALICAKKHEEFKRYHEQINHWVKAYRFVERGFAEITLFSIDQQSTILITLLMLTSLYATWRREHIAFRAITSRLDHVVSHLAQLLASGTLSISAGAFYLGAHNSGTGVSMAQLIIILLLGSGAQALLSGYQLAQPTRSLTANSSILHALLAIPIHSWMLLAAAAHFFLREGHLPGIAIYFTQIFQLTNLHLSIALYIWVGMLLKETLLGAKLFAVFKPWNLPPEILAVVAIALMAVPTAYTGASGIIIIAMGAVVYQELRRVGTRRQLALAVTAMTGSSGVVLRPCLLVVGIAILNKQVVTDELYYWGTWVFMLTLLVFCFYALLTRQSPLSVTPFKQAIGPSLNMLRPLLPYAAIFVTSIVLYALLLNAYLDEFSAPIMLPVIIIAFIVFERRYSRSFATRNAVAGASPSIAGAFDTAISRASIQIGALVMLMACSFTIGGILERGGGIITIPEAFGSPYLAMAFMLLFLIFIGMVMDPFGALILVSGTVAPIAYSHGIAPIHFWMTALVAFELGYLSPPVSLNHLLTRQVVGDSEVVLASAEGASFYYRHEKIILPLLVMSTTLVIVAFGPLLIGYS